MTAAWLFTAAVLLMAAAGYAQYLLGVHTLTRGVLRRRHGSQSTSEPAQPKIASPGV
jgi:hypothetical protein